MSSAMAAPPEPAPSSKPRQPKLTNSVLLLACGVVLLLAPLAFGAVEPWAIFTLEALSFAILALWARRQWLHGEINITNNPLYRPMSAFLALAALQWLVGTSAYRHVTYTHLLLYAAYAMLAFVATQTLQRYSQFELMAQVLTAYGLLVAIFAILQGMAPNGKLYWVLALQQGGSIYGPYVNHNHYAGLMEMLTPFPLVLATTHFTEGNRKIFVAGIAALMAASIFLSGSRGGMAAFVAQMILLSVFLARKRDATWKQSLLLGAFLAVIIVFLVWMGGNELTRRLASIHAEAREEINGGVRLSIDRDCLRMVLKRPILGWGLGTFPIVYPGFRSFYTNFFVNQAHNDYLQMLVETGLAGLCIALWFAVLVVRNASLKLKNWTQTGNGALTVAALLGCTGILVHSFVDFNLQIPANAALFYVLCALAAAPPMQESHRRRVLRRHNLIVQPNLDSGAAS